MSESRNSDCPCCGYKGAFSMTVKNGRKLFHCHAGCSQDELLAAIKGGESPPCPELPKTRHRPNLESQAYILNLWHDSEPAGDIVKGYLASRGLTGTIPASIRFLPRHPHKPTNTHWPVMLSGVTDIQGKVHAIHRTYLSNDGLGKAPVEPAKMTLGAIGGFACHLSEPTEQLAVSEGIETGLSVQFATGIPTWAALNAGGIANLNLPPLPLASEVLISADADPVGMKVANTAALKWHREGRRVKISVPPTGKDFNDVIREANV